MDPNSLAGIYFLTRGVFMETEQKPNLIWLYDNVSAAKLAEKTAYMEFVAVVSEKSDGIPLTDYVDRIRTASAMLTMARTREMDALERLADFQRSHDRSRLPAIPTLS